MVLKVKILDGRAIIPTYATENSAGADIYNMNGCAVEIGAHQTVFIKTGLAIEIPDGFVGLVFARSGIASKRGLAPANKVGVIDSDYRGEWTVALHNHSDVPAVVDGGERIAQVVVVPCMQATFDIVDSLSETARGEGGFGSTGQK